ncbi:pentapeptide repeat-containing protein [Paenibacillus macerans]|uniref:Pentapeptide repeats family protein n=1 Tax=Paenibacillus macerans TaxID=44252 RepID=A0A090ZFV2_PAEMA|nr:pentapeptide repeat-containing protein [Paenibacillus macerans]KFN09070.1 pentapeptide repeats family protein [Paenibacillus macerans]MCY7559098.1 pentapeptide repeat-containing protein [Paenibacillus macerans]MEC0154512.1 pentapeptide repeat-containing protein [Paenibacillus macerans]MEC0333878.1 pentapeptide repeat-containing protein [Paenibacillus macerans]SUA83012.1 bTB/POZ domain-containing protein KCTD9 [Paenibacillus macerans]
MNKQDVLRQLSEEKVLPLLGDCLQEAELEFLHNRQRLTEQLKASFAALCRQASDMQQRSQKAPIAYIHYSMLRTSLLDQSFTYLLAADSREFYFDEAECAVTYDAGWAYRSYSRLLAELERESKKYMGLLSGADAERLALECAPAFDQYVTALLRTAMPELVKVPEFAALDKADRLQIRTGELMDRGEILYWEEKQAGEAEKIQALLESDEGDRGRLAYAHFRSLSLTGQSFNGKKMPYSDFSRGYLSFCRFVECNLVGTSWRGANLNGAEFRGSLLTDADFTDSDLQGAVFVNIGRLEPLDSIYRLPGLLGLRFDRARLDGADFTAAGLNGRVSFHEASLEGTRFRALDREKLDLSEEQAGSVHWIE